MQVHPIQPKLKPPGSKRLKLKCDALLSTFAFKFNLRRYIKAIRKAARKQARAQMSAAGAGGGGGGGGSALVGGRRRQGLTLVHFQLNLSCV